MRSARAETYRRDGFCSAGIVLAGREVAALRAEVDAWAQGVTPGAYGLIQHNLWTILPEFRRLVEDGRVAAAAREILGAARVILFQDNLVCKVPERPVEIQWHQDFSYWPLDRPDGITTWLALDDAEEEDGAMVYVPGSHLRGERQAADFIRGTGQPKQAGMDLIRPEGEATAVGAARAGELLLHHPLVWHRSGPSRRGRPRRAWTATWITPEVRWDPGHAPHPYNWSLQPQAGEAVQGAVFPAFG